jgi:hypothetical protein
LKKDKHNTDRLTWRLCNDPKEVDTSDQTDCNRIVKKSLKVEPMKDRDEQRKKNEK